MAEGILALLILIPALAVPMILSALVDGYMISSLYEWFIVPLYNLDPITIPQAIGLGMFSSYATYHFNTDSSETSEKTAGELLTTTLAFFIVRPLLILLMAYVVKLYI